MSNYFSNFSPQTKLVIVVVSIFLISLVTGMLVFGTNSMISDSLTAETLELGSEAIHITP